MKSFIIALLPGLEEETGEYFEKVPIRGSFKTLQLNHPLPWFRCSVFWIGYLERCPPRFSCKTFG